MTEEEDKGKKERMGWRDYVAIIIAMLTTTLLPLIIFILLLLAIVIVIGLVRFHV